MSKSEPKIQWGASLSIKACRQFDLDIHEVLEYALKELGLRRFRLMTYWDECEAEPGVYDFTEVHALIDKIADYNGEVTLCLGLRQPRWPECHPPEWTQNLTLEQRRQRLYAFIEAAVTEFRGKSLITSYQLENEALNRGIGRCRDYSRDRLKVEYDMVKRLDPEAPILMSTSNSWGLPLRRPRPDVYGFSLYQHQWTETGLSRRHRSAWFHRLRAAFIKYLWNTPVTCHELQMEPWGPKGTEQLTAEQQLELMGAEEIRAAVRYAQKSGFTTVDMWGLEWWYWRKTAFGDDELDHAVANAIAESQ